ncbi:MAG: hypothetical protein PHQ27_04960 [Victivallales bacterium]|nr:hypothetical protein [Victivallales bacterium]
MNQNQRRYLHIIAISFHIFGALLTLLVLMPILQIIIATAIISSGGGNNPPPLSFDMLLLIMNLSFMTAMASLAGCSFYTGHCIAERKHHLFCLVVSALVCLMFPWGTALGILAVILLAQPEVKAEFNLSGPNPTTGIHALRKSTDHAFVYRH